MPTSTPPQPLTDDQIKAFYRSLPHAFSAAADMRERFRANDVSYIMQLRNLDEGEAQKRAEKTQKRFKALKGNGANAAVIIALLNPPRKGTDLDNTVECEQSRFHVLLNEFSGDHGQYWRIPTEEFADAPEFNASLADHSELRRIADDIHRYSDAVIQQCILPHLSASAAKHKSGSEKSEGMAEWLVEKWPVEVTRVLMAASVVADKFEFTTIAAANEFFVEATQRFMTAREKDINDFKLKWSEFCIDAVPIDKLAVAGEVWEKLERDLRRATNPPPEARLQSEKTIFTWVRKTVGTSEADTYRSKKHKTVSLPDENILPGSEVPPSDGQSDSDKNKRFDLSLGISQTLNTFLDSAFGPDVLFGNLAIAEERFCPGAAVVFLMQFAKTEEGKKQAVAYEEILEALNSGSRAVSKQFHECKEEVSIRQIWENHVESWNSLLAWKGELPHLQLPASWDDVRGRIARRIQQLGDQSKDSQRKRKHPIEELREEWEDFVEGLIYLRLGSIVFLLKELKFKATGADGTPRMEKLLRAKYFQLLTSNDGAITHYKPLNKEDGDKPDSEREIDWTVSCDDCWSQILAVTPGLGLPESLSVVRSWFAGSFMSSVSNMITTLLNRGLYVMRSRAREIAETDQGRGSADRTQSSVHDRPSAWVSPAGLSDIIRVGNLWYVATVGTVESSGRQGVRVLGSADGQAWKPIGVGIADDRHDLTLPRFVRPSEPESLSNGMLPSIQCEAWNAESGRRETRVLDYSADSVSWLMDAPILPHGEILSRVLSGDSQLYAAVRHTTPDGTATLSLYGGVDVRNLTVRVDLRSTLPKAHSDLCEASFVDDLAYATDATLFIESEELWCIIHCAGSGWSRTWIGVCTLNDLDGWNWWHAEAARFDDHRYVIPSREECELPGIHRCALRPASVCQTPDGSWWLSATMSTQDQRYSDDVLCRLFLPNRGDREFSPVAMPPLICATKRLSRYAGAEVRHVGAAADGQYLITTYHESDDLDRSSSFSQSRHRLRSRKFYVIARQHESVSDR